MPTTETIQIPVEVLDKATRRSNEISKDLDGIGKSASRGAMGMTELNSAVSLMRQGFQALKQVYDFAKEGANIEYTAEKFDRLAVSIGTTGDVLLNEMKVATKGTLSDMEAMAAASDILALGLANTQEEAIRLATVQAGLSMDMNQLVLTLTNQTTMRFDALGVRVDGFKQKVKALEDQGYSTNDAFKEAFLQQAEQQLETVGNAADTSAGSFKRFEAALKDLGDQAKTTTADGLVPLVEHATVATKGWQEFLKYLGDTSAIRKQAQAMRDFQDPGGQWQQFYEEARVLYFEANDTLDDLGITTDEYTARILHQAVVIENSVIPNLEDMTKANKKYLDDVGKASDDYRTYTDKMNDISQERAEIEGKMQADLALGWWEGSEKILEYKDKLDELAEKEREYTDDFERNKDKRILAAVEENLAKDGLTEEEMRQLEELGLARGIYTEEAIANMRREREEIQGITDDIMGIPNRTVTIEVSATGTGLNLLSKHGDTKVSTGIHERRDSGGRGMPGMPYIIGQGAQPEAFIPDSPGTFVPNIDKKMGAMSGGSSEIDYNKMARAFTQALQKVMQ